MNSNAGVGGRRVLHQPFFPVDSSPSPPLQTPSPPPPSTDQSPFFPTLPSPPPPSSSSSLASFPANISSLPIPHSSPSPKTHVSPALISVTVALSLLALSITLLSLFLFLRNRLLRSKHPQQHVTKPHTPSPSSRSDPLPPPPPPLNSANNSHLKNSSEFLYLGTMANSSAAVRESGVRTTKFDPRKTDSPDLQPLPPLSRRNGGSSVVVVVPEDAEEEEEFFSPRGSANGSASARAFSAAVRVIEQDSSPDSSSSSSHTCSPPRSASLSISPPVTGTTKSLPVEDDDSSPERDSEVKQTPEEEEAEESPLLSNGGSSSSSQLSSPVESPCLSPLWSMAGKSSPPAGDWSVINRSQTRLSPISDRSILSSKTSSIIKLPRFLGGGGTGKGSPESTKMSNSPESSLTASPMSRSSSSKISYSPGRNAVSNPESPVISSRWSNQSSPEVRHLPNIAVRPPAPPPPPPPPLPTMRQRSESPVLVEQENNNSLDSSNGNGEGVDVNVNVNVNDEETPKPKLKPLHWDKVRASSDKEMVWDQLRSSSFKLNEEMIETLFVVKNPNLKPKETSTNPVVPSPRQDDRVLDPKKAQNIAISLRALNVTVEEVCEALLEGNAEMLGTDLLESLLKMAPTKEEEWKLREYKDDSPCKLGHAERFLKTLICIPYAFKRVEAMLYVTNFESEVEYLKKSFETLENACDELRSSRMFLKLLEAVLKTGNRMNVGTNRGDAHAFKLDTLHKLVDVKGADGKTTLLHFVVQEMIRTEGARLCNANQTASTAPTANEEAKCRKLGLQVVSCLGSELANVKKAAAMDSDSLTVEVAKLSMGLAAIAEVVALNEKTGSQESSRKFSESMNKFIRTAEEDIIRVQAQESVALSLVKEITEYFHGDSAKEEAHPFRIFMVVRDFLAVLDRVCKEVGTINDRTVVTSGHRFPVPVNPMLPVPANPTVAQGLTELFHQYKRHSSSSEGESSS